MKTSSVLHNSLWSLFVVTAGLACNVESRPLDTGGIGPLPREDAGAENSDESKSTAEPDAGNAQASGGDEDAGQGTSQASSTAIDAGVAPDAGSSDAQALDAQTALDGATPDDDAPEVIVESKVRGYLAVESDYSSINVSVWDAKGKRLSASLVSSSSEDPGLSAPFSWDVVVPTQNQVGDEVVFIDRANGVLTWVSLSSGNVERQLDVKIGDFYANPYDYVAYDDNTAFVTRYGVNELGGAVDYDRGSDVLVINPSTFEVTGSIDLVAAMNGDSHPPRPSRAVLAGGYLRVLLEGWDFESGTFAPARLVTIDPVALEVSHVLVLNEVQNCTTLAVSPTGTSLAFACTGPWSSADSVARSGIVHVSAEAEPRVLLSKPASELGGEQVNAVAFTGPSTVVYTTFGRTDPDTFELLVPDAVRVLDLASARMDKSATYTSDAAFALSSVRCSVVGKRCFVADASTNGGILRQLTIRDDGRLDDVTPRANDASTHVMPPRYLGSF